MGSAPVRCDMKWRAASVLLSAVVTAGAASAVALHEQPTDDVPVPSGIEDRIDALEKKISDLDALAASLTRDNRDLEARLRLRAGQKSVVPEPAVAGDPAVLVAVPAQGVNEGVVLIWDSSGGPMAGAKVIAKMRSGFPIRVLDTERSGDTDWIHCYTYHFTQNSLGWVSAQTVRVDKNKEESEPQNKGR